MFRVFVYDDNVPSEEYADIQRLLNDNDIDYVERRHLIGSVYRFGSRGAGCDLLVDNEDKYRRARELIDRYQEQLVAAARAEFEASRSRNRNRERVGWIFGAIVILGLLALWINALR